MAEVSPETSVSGTKPSSVQTPSPDDSQRRVSHIKKLAARMFRPLANNYLDHATFVTNRGKNRVQVYQNTLGRQIDDDDEKRRKNTKS